MIANVTSVISEMKIKSTNLVENGDSNVFERTKYKFKSFLMGGQMFDFGVQAQADIVVTKLLCTLVNEFLNFVV